MVSLSLSAPSARTFLQGLPYLLATAGILFFQAPANAQRVSPADAYFLEFSLNALRRPVFCHPLDSAGGAARCYAVSYDTLGRPTQITRLFFGNLDSYSQWTIMKYRYDTLPSGSQLVRRTWHNPSGFPVQIGIGFGEDVLYDSTGALLMITAIDNEAQRVERVNAVTRSIFRSMPDGSWIQEWRYANNRQYSGVETDVWATQFAPLDKSAWFRKFLTDGNGHLTEEIPWSIAKKPIPFPGGESVRRYDRDTCGRLLSVRFVDLDGNSMADSSGVARINYEYDAKGRLLSWNALNLRGEKQGRKDFRGAATMSRTYRDFDGTLIQEKMYDAKGQEIEQSAEPQEAMQE